MNKLRLITMLVIFLISLLAPETQAANYLPEISVLSPAPQQDDNPRTAQLGENQGQVPEGGSEIWTYEGKAGEVLTIKAEADKPANEADPEERRQAGLLDMLLIIYAPDGTIIAKADDIQPGIVTDAVIEGLELPADGTYQIEVLGLESSGAYTLTLQAGSATPVDPTATSDPDWPTLTIENQLEDTICYVYIWPTSTDEVGNELLGTKEVILPNSSHQSSVAPDEYDIVLSDCYGNMLDQRWNFDITNSSTLKISPLDGPAAQCAEGIRLFYEYRDAEASSLLEAGFVARKSATFADPNNEGLCALTLGELRDNTGNRSGALEAYQVALDIFQASGNREFEGITLDNVGLVYGAQGKYEQALELHKQALEIYREVGNRASVGTTINNIGGVYLAQGKYEQALESHQQALEIFGEVGDRSGVGIALDDIGLAYGAQGKYEQALESHQQALEIYREVGDRAGVGTTINNIGGVYHAQGKYEQALLEHQQALEIAREVGDRASVGTTLDNIGGVYLAQGKYDQALDLYKQTLEIASEVGNRASVGATINDIGGVYDNQGKYEQALLEYQQALFIFGEVGNRAGVGAAINNIGGVYHNQGKYEQALLEYQQALEIAREVGNRAGEGTTINNIGLVYHAQGKYEQALELYKNSLEISREVGDRAGEGQSLNNIGLVYDNQGKYDQALDLYQKALEISREVGNRVGVGITLDNIGFVYEQQGQAEEALVYYEQAMDVFETVRATAGDDEERASFIAEHAGLYDRAIGLYHQQGQDEAAFFTSERGRARSFLDSLATGEVRLSDEQLQELLARERDVYAQRFAIQDELARVRAQNPPDAERRPELVEGLVADLEARLEAAEEAYSKVQGEIEARGDELLALVPGRRSVPTLDEVQALLDEQTTLVSYWVRRPELVEGLGEEGTLAFVMTHESLQVIELPAATPDNLFTAVDELFLWPSIDEPHPESLQTLHAWLVEPLTNHLNTPKVGIIPHQLLHYVPFAALTDGESYFGSQKVLFWLPSASALRFVQDKAKEAAQTDSQGALVFGNPTTNEKGLGSLPRAADEAETVANLFATAHYVKREATETQLRESVAGQKVVHLAAHGVYNSVVPLENTFIALASDGEHDGRLETGEVYGLELSGSELVTLSACQTQIGELDEANKVVSAGDEIVGLTRAFFFAGTPTVLSSLWNVDDAATEALMTAFYRNWQSGMGKAEALQAAQAEIRETYPSPYYWAGFVLSGDAGEVTKSGTSLAQKVALAIAGLLGVGLLLVLGITLRKRSRV